MARPSKDEYYLNVAKEICQRSTCQRRRFGAIIVRDDQIISTGYPGSPRGAVNCLDVDQCPRTKAGIKPGDRYDLCRSVHAEQNAIINAARAGVSLLGGTMYLYGENGVDGGAPEGELLVNLKPCKMCRRVIINAGLKDIIVRDPAGIIKYVVEDWIKDEPIDLTKIPEGY